MHELVACLRESLSSGRQFVYCRLVETRGSTPQKAGATMLVFPDGSQKGTLGGGCVEAEVKRRAMLVLSSGNAEVAKFQLDSDYGWDDGLICGGRMQVLLVPLGNSTADSYFERLAGLVEKGDGFTEAILFDGSAANLPPPAGFLFNDQDELVASLWMTSSGRSVIEQQVPPIVIENLRPLAARQRPYAISGVAYLPTQARSRLLIVGGGHVGQAVANLAADLEFEVSVVDDRPEYVTEQRFPRAKHRIAGRIEDILPNLAITPDTYCLIVTRGHSHDEQALYYLADRGARYVGMIGSRRKIKMIFADLLAEGVAAEALARVHAPLGIDIGSQTVAEIAVSICAELVSYRNRDGVVPGRPDPVRVTDDVLP